MKAILITRFISDCGSEFRHKSSCIKHEKKCKCFSNPKYRTCLTCKFNNGFIREDYDRYRDCIHNEYNFDKLKPYLIPNTKTYDCVNCPLYEPKEDYNGTFEKWEQKKIDY